MSEVSEVRQTIPVATAITSALEGWLREEVKSSSQGSNSILDDHAEFLRDLTLPYPDPSNANAAKNRGHHERLVQFTELFASDYAEMSPTDKDQSIAKQIFCAQMYLSGLFRTQCMLEALDQDDYLHRRSFGAGIGIDIEAAVEQGFKSLLGYVPASGDFGRWPRTPAVLADNTRRRNTSQRRFVQALHGDGVHSGRLVSMHTHGDGDEGPYGWFVQEGLCLQRSWVREVVSYVVFAARDRNNDLSAVPFLEPKSISEAQIYYPFAEAA